ncbi:MAG: tectonin domain-containing protein, partial [Acidimicrobiales bacterium]
VFTPRIPRAAAAAVLLLALLPLLTRGAGAVGGATIDVVIEDSHPAMIWEPGAKAAFGIAVTNTSSEPVTITAATESLDGSPDFDISAVNGPVLHTTCGDAVGTELAAGGIYTCNFMRYVGGDPGDVLTETATVTAQDGRGSSTSDQGDRSYEILDSLPAADVTNSPDLTAVSAPGADVTYTTSVTNTSPEPVTITAATESLGGGPAYDLSTVNGPVLNTTCDDAVGTVLAPEATYSCDFMVFVGGGAGAVRTDRVTFTFRDDESNTASSHADHTFVIVAGPSRAVWGVTSAGSVYRFDARWARQSARLAQIDVGNKGEVWGVTAAGSVYRRVGSGGWSRMPGSLKQVSVGSNSDGSTFVWGLASDGSVYRYAGGYRWTNVGGRLEHVSAGTS